MKKFKKVKSLLSGFILIFAFCFTNNVYAKTMTPDEIQGPAYVIGSHVFTREVNESTGYQGRLTTNLIMFASQTIESSNLDNMIIYYKTATGMWIDGLTGSPIDAPESFEINYTNMQLEEVNNTVSTPKAPILSLNGGVLNIDEETDIMQYQLDIYIDDIENPDNKIDGVEVVMIDDNRNVTTKDLIYDKDFSAIITVLDSYTGNDLTIGKQYHRGFISFENPAAGDYQISAKAYIKDDNGKKYYSDTVYITIYATKTFPSVEIVNNYSNPDYINFDGNKYTYKLGIKKPDSYVFKIKPEKFAYIVYESTEGSAGQIGTFGINEEFTIEVPKDSVKTYTAQLGYYTADGIFSHFILEHEEVFTIDTRKTITTPVVELDQREENYNYTRRYGDIIEVDFSMYKNADKNTLDYNVKGIEFYEIYSDDGTHVDSFHIESLFEVQSSSFVQVKPEYGIGTYVGRAYAINALGQKVYSEYSNIVTVIRTPEIEVSNIEDGKVKVSIKNIEEYGSSELKYKVFNKLGEELTNLIKLEEVSSIDVDSNTQLYIRIYKVSDESGETYSAKSNKVDIVIE